ncbi:MAG: sugar transferase, partial [Synergistaceae bacterium]|nr:sugar transferase [Synergistaceae bacterium]
TQSDVDLFYGDIFAKKVYSAKPGLTGIWQVSGRSDLDADFRREINCYYVHNWSVWLDITILMKTPLVVISHKGAY